MSGDDYLAECQRASPVCLSGGIGDWLRSRLDRNAVSYGQRSCVTAVCGRKRAFRRWFGNKEVEAGYVLR